MISFFLSFLLLSFFKKHTVHFESPRLGSIDRERDRERDVQYEKDRNERVGCYRLVRVEKRTSLHLDIGSLDVGRLLKGD